MTPYRFHGYIYEVTASDVVLILSDLTDPSFPDEEWVVELKHFPSTPIARQFVDVTIDETGCRFSFTPLRQFTAEELSRIAERASEYSALFGVSES